MPRALLTLLLLLASLGSQAADVRVIVVRHAEKASDGTKDPGLTPAGQARADELARLLDNEHLVAIYATQYRRTQLTARPTALAAGLRIRARRADEPADLLAATIRHSHHEGTVLVVGHSDTVPALVTALSGQAVPPIADDEFDRYFIITLPEKGPARLESGHYPGSLAPSSSAVAGGAHAAVPHAPPA